MVPVFTTLKLTAIAGVANFNKCGTEPHHIYNKISAPRFRCFSGAGQAQERKYSVHDGYGHGHNWLTSKTSAGILKRYL